MKKFIKYTQKNISEKDVIQGILSYGEITTEEYEEILRILAHGRIKRSFPYKSDHYDSWARRIRHIFVDLFDIPIRITDSIIHGRYKVVLCAEPEIVD